MRDHDVWMLHRAATFAGVKAGCRGDFAAQAHALAWVRAAEVVYLRSLAERLDSCEMSRWMLGFAVCSVETLMDREAAGVRI